MKRLIILLMACLLAFYVFKPYPRINPQYIAVFKKTVGCCYIIPPPLDEDGPSEPAVVHYEGDVWGTVNLVRETKSTYCVEYVNSITKRVGYKWVPKEYIRLEKINGR